MADSPYCDFDLKWSDVLIGSYLINIINRHYERFVILNWTVHFRTYGSVFGKRGTLKGE